jgi:hypothetical protein
MCTGQIGRLIPSIEFISLQEEITVSWPWVWEIQWTLRFIMSKDSYTVSIKMFKSKISVKEIEKELVWFDISLKYFHSGRNKCGVLNGGCSHLCLPVPISFDVRGYVCAYPDNVELLNGKRR